MREIPYFDWSPKGGGWLHKANLKPNELVRVNGQVYRYSEERDGRERILTPVQEGRK